jgi:hypothetical protein
MKQCEYNEGPEAKEKFEQTYANSFSGSQARKSKPPE